MYHLTGFITKEQATNNKTLEKQQELSNYEVDNSHIPK